MPQGPIEETNPTNITAESQKIKALFLDRDGVINKDINYLCDAHKCEFIPGVFDFCLLAQKYKYKIFVVTNQAGIARGYYSEQKFLDFTKWMESVFDHKGINIIKTYYCPHHPEFGNDIYKQVCDCRKPAPGMILKAIAEYNIDPIQSILIGDKETDIQAAISANIQQAYLFESFEKISKIVFSNVL